MRSSSCWKSSQELTQTRYSVVQAYVDIFATCLAYSSSGISNAEILPQYEQHAGACSARRPRRRWSLSSSSRKTIQDCRLAANNPSQFIRHHWLLGIGGFGVGVEAYPQVRGWSGAEIVMELRSASRRELRIDGESSTAG